jgi:hypothetical protein
MAGMNRRLVCVVLAALLALQAVTAPLAWASAPASAASAPAHDCGGSVPVPDRGDECPCCPDSGDCSQRCTASQPAVIADTVVAAALLVPATFDSSASGIAGRADVPLHPPPIR